jgi:hypothetical protein
MRPGGTRDAAAVDDVAAHLETLVDGLDAGSDVRRKVRYPAAGSQQP